MKFATLLSVSLLASAAAFAETSATTANVIGVLRVDSAAKRTIVAVPWVAAGVADGNIKVTDLVKTSNLTPGDTLYYYNGETFDSWVLMAGESGQAPVWQAAVGVTENGKAEENASPDVQGLPRGGAILLDRKTPSAPFYLQGQVGTTDIASKVIAAGTVAAPVYSLIAPPKVQNEATFALSSLKFTGTIGAKDRIFIYLPSGETKECQYKDGKWKYNTWTAGENGWMTESWSEATIPTGTGFWYVSTTATPPTIEW